MIFLWCECDNWVMLHVPSPLILCSFTFYLVKGYLCKWFCLFCKCSLMILLLLFISEGLSYLFFIEMINGFRSLCYTPPPLLFSPCPQLGGCFLRCSRHTSCELNAQLFCFAAGVSVAATTAVLLVFWPGYLNGKSKMLSVRRIWSMRFWETSACDHVKRSCDLTRLALRLALYLEMLCSFALLLGVHI